LRAASFLLANSDPAFDAGGHYPEHHVVPVPVERPDGAADLYHRHEKVHDLCGLDVLAQFDRQAVSRRGKPMEHLLMAGSVIAMLPSIVIFFTLQRYFIKGVIMTGIKG
jgi:hypothetical protein